VVPLNLQPILSSAATCSTLIFELEKELMNLFFGTFETGEFGDEPLILSLFNSNNDPLLLRSDIGGRTRTDFHVLLATLAKNRAFQWCTVK
jgi:hypothetical protein